MSWPKPESRIGIQVCLVDQHGREPSAWILINHSFVIVYSEESAFDSVTPYLAVDPSPYAVSLFDKFSKRC